MTTFNDPQDPISHCQNCEDTWPRDQKARFRHKTNKTFHLNGINVGVVRYSIPAIVQYLLYCLLESGLSVFTKYLLYILNM